MKIVLDYNPTVGGEISYTDPLTGKVTLVFYKGLEHLKENPPVMTTNKIDDIVKLKNSGMRTNEIVEIFQSGIV